MIGRLQCHATPGAKAQNSVDNPLLFFILQAGQNREVSMSKWLILPAVLVSVWDSCAFSQPIFAPPVNVGTPINSASSEWDPFLTADGKKFFFVSLRDNSIDIWFSEMTDTGWTQARMLGPRINYGVDLQTSPSVSPDGQKLYYVDASRDGFSWDIWVSTFDSAANDWSTPQNVGWPVNTPGVEFSARIGPDGQHLYFSSSVANGENRCGLYVSEWDGSSWSVSSPLGAGQCGISEYPTITADLTEIYYYQYVSDGTSIFVQCWNGSAWGPQVDLRPQLIGNTGSSFITPSGDSLFFTGCDDFSGFGSCDIWLAIRLISGDLNLDSQLTIADVVLELYKVFLNQAYPAPSGAGDLICDGRFTAADISLLLLKVFGVSYSVQEPNLVTLG
jgi:Tol biopolymer transport system component